jgi:hypothetical protein
VWHPLKMPTRVHNELTASADDRETGLISRSRILESSSEQFHNIHCAGYHTEVDLPPSFH